MTDTAKMLIEIIPLYDGIIVISRIILVISDIASHKSMTRSDLNAKSIFILSPTYFQLCNYRF